MKFILVLSIVLAALSRKTNLKSKTKGNVDYKPVLIDGFSHGDAVAAINDQKITLFKKIGTEPYGDYSHSKKTNKKINKKH